MNTLRHIRKVTFGVTQHEFAVIAGVQQSTVSRWESGTAAPTLEEMSAIRREAQARRLRWNDRMFFEAPPDRVSA
jgi:DNA-binding transcriptional regulator YiaG